MLLRRSCILLCSLTCIRLIITPRGLFIIWLGEIGGGNNFLTKELGGGDANFSTPSHKFWTFPSNRHLIFSLQPVERQFFLQTSSDTRFHTFPHDSLLWDMTTSYLTSRIITQTRLLSGLYSDCSLEWQHLSNMSWHSYQLHLKPTSVYMQGISSSIVIQVCVQERLKHFHRFDCMFDSIFNCNFSDPINWEKLTYHSAIYQFRCRNSI